MSLDPRHASEEKITPPWPLPHVSRRALMRVKNPLPAPTVCPYCEGGVHLVGNDEIYGRRYGDWPYAYKCAGKCRAYVGLHPNTDIPLGTLADAELREARKSAKKLFHQIQDSHGWSRNHAYAWLAGQLRIEVADCHFGWFDLQQCERAEKACSLHIECSSKGNNALEQELSRLLGSGALKI